MGEYLPDSRLDYSLLVDESMPMTSQRPFLVAPGLQHAFSSEADWEKATQKVQQNMKNFPQKGGFLFTSQWVDQNLKSGAQPLCGQMHLIHLPSNCLADALLHLNQPHHPLPHCHPFKTHRHTPSSSSLLFFRFLHKHSVERASIGNNEWLQFLILTSQPVAVQVCDFETCEMVWVTQAKTFWNTIR